MSRTEKASYLSLDVDTAVERMGDGDIYREIARCFAENMEQTLRNLERAICDADMQTATRFAHSLKGNCSTVGAEELRRACLRLEHRCREAHMDEARALFADLRPKLLALRGELLAL